MKTSTSVALRLRQILDQKKMSIQDLQDITGLSKGTITSLLYSRYEGVNIRTVFIILLCLDVPVLEFFDSPLFKDLHKLDLE